MILIAMLWLFGFLALSSAIMIVSWGWATFALIRDGDGTLWSMRHKAGVVVAAGLTVHAFAMMGASGYRAFDLAVNRIVPAGSSALWLMAWLWMLAISKLMFVWAGTQRGVDEQPRWPWFAFLYAMALWLVACVAIMGGSL